MGFRVRPDDIRLYGGLLSKQTEHNEAARDYAKKKLSVATGEESGGAIIPAMEYNIDAMESVLDAIDTAGKFFDDAGKAIRETADYYEEVDEDEAAKFDKDISPEYKWSGDGSIESEPSTGPVATPAEKVNPSNQLKEPKAKGVTNDPFDLLTDLNKSASLSNGAREITKYLAGFDPFEEAAQYLIGDWEAFAKASDACTKLANFYEKISINVDQYATLAETWNGRAAYQTFLSLKMASSTFHGSDGSTLACYSGQFETLHDAYGDLAQGVHDLAKAIEGLLSSVLETVLWIIAAAAGVGVTGWTGVTAALGSGVAGGAAVRITSQVLEYSGKIDEVRSLVNGFMGMEAIDGSDGYQFSELEFDIYEHPGA